MKIIETIANCLAALVIVGMITSFFLSPDVSYFSLALGIAAMGATLVYLDKKYPNKK